MKQVNPATILGRLSPNIMLICKNVYILHSSSNYNLHALNLLDNADEIILLKDRSQFFIMILLFVRYPGAKEININTARAYLLTS